MCAKKKSVTASRCEDVSEDKTSSSALGNTVRSRYRVLRAAMGRPIPRSVDRNCASRNAKPEGSSVKVSSPDKHLNSVVAMRVLRSEAIPKWNHESPCGTTGVQGHGEFRRQLLELGRSLAGRSSKIRFYGQSIIAEPKIILTREVRYLHSSVEVGQCP